MIDDIIVHINNKIKELRIVSKLFGLCELVGEELKSPAEYCNGEFRSVADFDFFNGVVYHRIIGDTSVSEDEDEDVSGCFSMKTFRVPMRTCAIIKRKGQRTDLLVGQTILGAISFKNNKNLRIALGADTVAIEPNNIIIDKERLLNEEFEGQDISIDYEDLFVAVEYDIIITGAAHCIDKLGCGDRSYSEDYSNDYD